MTAWTPGISDSPAASSFTGPRPWTCSTTSTIGRSVTLAAFPERLGQADPAVAVEAGAGTDVGLRLALGVAVGVPVGAAVPVGVAVPLGVTVPVGVAVPLGVTVPVGVGVRLGMEVVVGVGVAVGAGGLRETAGRRPGPGA